jgi:putative nucleotidyltransferase with HDIG domain
MEAEELARKQLVDLPRRIAHVCGVARRAAWVAEQMGVDRNLLVAASWLHDIGYASSLVTTGFHSLDGARYLRRLGVDSGVVNLVAHHSCALREAEERGLKDELLAEFPIDRSLPHDWLCYCDMTTGPDGQTLDVTERLAEIRSRYRSDDVVTRFVTKAEPEVAATVRQVEGRLAVQSR